MRKELAESLFNQAELEIDAIEISNELNLTSKRKGKVEIASSFLAQLKEKMLEYQFESEDEEIWFFKKIKPKFNSLLIYYSNVERIELDKPEGGSVHVKSFYESELKNIKRIFEANRQIYHYYRSEADFLDSQLFLRGVPNPPRWLCKIRVDQDERFSTAGDYMFARIMATEQLAKFIQHSMVGLDFNLFSTNENEIETTWTGESINLLEMIYGVHYTAQVNGGKIGIGELVKKFEKFFNVSLGRPYRRFTEIKQRKRLSRTKFIDEMAKSINKKIDDENEYVPL